MERSGARDWFSDNLFVEAQSGHARAGAGGSIAVHLVCAIAAVIALVMRPERPIVVAVRSPLRTPDVRIMPLMTSASLAPAAPAEPAAVPSKAAKTAAPPATAPGPRPPAPIEAPSDIEPEGGAETGGDGVEGGVEGGVAGGVPGGTIGGVIGGAPSAGPLPVGGGVSPPRKIKDVKPVYPPGALSDDLRGSVVIEATIGTDGKVLRATVVHSVPELDQAALDAVRQWQYAPSMLNGVAVAVLVTVVVNFAIQ